MTPLQIWPTGQFVSSAQCELVCTVTGMDGHKIIPGFDAFKIRDMQLNITVVLNNDLHTGVLIIIARKHESRTYTVKQNTTDRIRARNALPVIRI